MSKLSSTFRGDKYIWLIVVVLSLLGIAAVYSATGSLAFARRQGNTEFDLLRHTGFVFIGFGLLYASHLLNYKYFSRISQLLIVVSIGLLVLTLAIGSNINNATRVLPIPGLGVTFQTSDMAKLALFMYIARFLNKHWDEITSWKSFVSIMVVIIIVVLLIAPENLSTALVIFTTSIMLLFIGRMNLKYIFSLIGAGSILLVILGLILYSLPTDSPSLSKTRIPTWKGRLESFFDKENEGSYQSVQSKIAVASGGVFGKGPGNSTQRNYLPHPYSDFIYAIIIEEYGLFGGITVLFLYLFLIFRCLQLVIRSKEPFGAYLALGLGFSMSFQALINMGVAVGILPVTGLTLPLVSMGGTSIVFTSIAFGVILSVSRSVEEENKAPLEVQQSAA